MTQKKISILGSTGSIGVSTLDVVRQHPDLYRVVALSGGRNVDVLAQQVREFKPALVSVQDADSAKKLSDKISDLRCEVVVGDDGAVHVALAPQADTVVSAMVGAVGLKPTYAAICAGKTVALANKETLVMAGQCMTDAVKKYGATMLPIDSEHSAILQCMQGQPRARIQRVILTASGGPFRSRAKETFAHITKAEALKHPNWSMGHKITIDSASMMNKGLEFIEAMWLFDLNPAQIEIVVHPQSIIHSMVEYCDGSIMAQLSNPDMRGPIAYALAYPDRITSGIPPIDFKTLSQLTFETPDPEKFPALRIARQAAIAGG
ncbi:MAG: 1-deoxy-D-xylulose-5-phosphate reductoisomerase, partial [Sideroxyarcus sp.]|nr:1-deoxy-D-xylulose-5-phosphate reductoisomerase [Sideroxyarcus sp.]